ncbi:MULTISPECIES: helix-turn-helix transcriptional regulator [unclassified Marinimicrobium]|uniref:helix-turn-helix transcriptional regulator n=1 Tax=unclassified Marinimicrobium TaxID=2632100 RepID=UPI000C53B702|nr:MULTISPECIES: LuxR family transcriptional regulator [unclassified Marinimicrobium]MAN52808.1 LuxR family transcriptional regulator [Marinimicrobium sp.]
MNDHFSPANPQTDQQASLPFPALKGEELHAYNELVSTLYRSLHNNAGFQHFFDAFQKHFKALQGGILGVTANPQRILYGWTFGYPDGFEEWYINSDLPERDEALTRYVQLPPRQFDSFLRGDVSRTILDILGPESRAWAESVGMGDSTGMLVTREDGVNVVFMANRHQDHGPYTDSELLQMNLLAPHIENAVALHLKLYQSSSDNENLAMALNHVHKPLMVFNALGNVAEANNAARALLDSTGNLFVGEDRRLHSRDRRMTRKLHDAITTCIVLSHKGVLESQTLFIQNGQARVSVCLTPLVTEHPENNGVLAELFSFDTTLSPDLDKLQSLFQCSPAEAAVAGGLMRGLSTNDIAEERHISIHTARQHIKSLLAKNGYRKQTELVSMLVRALG